MSMLAMTLRPWMRDVLAALLVIWGLALLWLSLLDWVDYDRFLLSVYLR